MPTFAVTDDFNRADADLHGTPYPNPDAHGWFTTGRVSNDLLLVSNAVVAAAAGWSQAAQSTVYTLPIYASIQMVSSGAAGFQDNFCPVIAIQKNGTLDYDQDYTGYIFLISPTTDADPAVGSYLIGYGGNIGDGRTAFGSSGTLTVADGDYFAITVAVHPTDPTKVRMTGYKNGVEVDHFDEAITTLQATFDTSEGISGYDTGYIGVRLFSTEFVVDNWGGGSFTGGTTITKTPSGGIVLGGSASRTKTVAPTKSGGVVLGGNVVRTVTKARTSSGGPVLGGTAARTRTVARTASGGLVLGGSSSTTKTVAPAKSGGLVLGGSAARTRTVAPATSGGLVLGGAASAVTRTISPVPTGGPVLGGSATRARTVARTPAGGPVLGGSTTRTRTVAPAKSGGIVLAGTSSYESGGNVFYAPAGGLHLGGSTARTRTIVRTATGGIVLAGSAPSSSGVFLFATVTGGLVLGGRRTGLAVTRRGGLVLGGTAAQARTLTATVTGGVVLGGTAIASKTTGPLRDVEFTLGPLSSRWGAGTLAGGWGSGRARAAWQAGRIT